MGDAILQPLPNLIPWTADPPTGDGTANDQTR
jgi:hypothetical protein